MKINKKTKDLLNEFECAIAAVECEGHVGVSDAGRDKAQLDYEKSEDELHRHLFKLEERLRKYKRVNAQCSRIDARIKALEEM